MKEVFIGLIAIIGTLVVITLISYLLGCLMFRNNPFKTKTLNDGATYGFGLMLLLVIFVITIASYLLGHIILNE